MEDRYHRMAVISAEKLKAMTSHSRSVLSRALRSSTVSTTLDRYPSPTMKTAMTASSDNATAIAVLISGSDLTGACLLGRTRAAGRRFIYK
jgi:hypothetical protein